MRKHLGKRLISLALSIAVFVTSVPLSSYAAETNTTAPSGENIAQQSVTESEKSLEYALNGGSFVSGYEAPASYPATELPDWEDVEKAGYAFGGWYENEDLSGEAVRTISDKDHTGVVVLYAKWTDPYYYVDIPADITAEGGELKLTGKADGLYESEQVSVSVSSENNWKLKDSLFSLPYELRDVDTSQVVQNDMQILNLSQGQKSDETTYACNVTKEPEVTGQYTDTLTFQVAFKSKNYTIRYEANGGFQDDKDHPGEALAFETQTMAPGTLLSPLPTAIRPGYTFLGWCYDEACTQYVGTEDRLLKDLTLYASYTENQPLESHEIATFARAIDVNKDSLVIQITDQSNSMTPEQILAASTLKNLSDFNEDTTIRLSAAGNGTYTVVKPGGWKEGSSYKLVLDNENLSFAGFDPSIREYEISIHKDEVRNVELNQEIRYIHIRELSNLIVNGQQVQSVNIAAMTVGMNGAVQSQGSSTTGSFTYTGSPLKTGDQIAVYSGDVIPTMGDVISSEDGKELSFFEITGVNGNQYTYRGSEMEDVLFMPEVLPLDVTKDQDGDTENNSVTVAMEELTFGDDERSRQLELDADTTVDEGDFLALYDGSGSSEVSYGKIISVQMSDGTYIIDYELQSWDEVQAAMDVYSTQTVSGDALLADTDTEALAKNIEDQAVESGFAEEVAQQISEMAMRTESYEDLQKMIEEELGADVEISTYAAVPLAGAKQKRVEVGRPQVKADLDTKLRHFDGNESGVHLGLEISVPITFHVARYADFTITVKATFEQEVRVAVNVDGEAVWKVWGIFPYIADYRVSASLDLYEYTGIGLDVNFKTEKANNLFLAGGTGDANAQFKKKQKLANDIEGISNELQEMMQNGKEYISDKSPLMANLGQKDTRSGGEEISVAKSLAERYADLLEDESEWVEIYTKRIIAKHIRVILVIDIAIELDFVVSANVNISLGMTFWYKNAKRYVFCLQVKGRKATSDTINITEEQYEFTAYAMGTLGIKAGVRLTVRVGLFSTELASVGVSADVGGYVQLWGYLYYILKYTASAGRDTKAMGALYLEVGIYLEIKFRAQALANAFTYSPTLYEAMWPLYTVGTVENVLDFAEPDELEINLKKSMKKVRLPEDFFAMSYLDLKEGLDDGEYFTKIYEDDSDRYFTIQMIGDAFTFDPKTDVITVNPGEEKSVDGEMIVTWKNQPGTFNTKPYQKKVKLHWDCLRNGYSIAFLSNGGTYVAPINQKYGTKVVTPAAPVKQGYQFAGWYRDEELTVPYTVPGTMPDEDVLVYAKWTPAPVSYTLKTYIEGTNGIYGLAENGTEKKMALTGTTLSPVPADLEGFETPAPRTAVAEADGNTQIEYYYARNRYTATYKSEDEVVSTGSYRYGTMMPVPAVYRPGYQFVGWIPEGGTDVEEVPVLVPAENRTYFAKWEPLTDIGYAVRYYVQNENGSGYVLSEIRYLTGTTGATVTAPEGGYDTAYYHRKDNAPLPSGEVRADGSLELKVYYDLNTYTVTYDTAAVDARLPEGTEAEFTARPGQKLVTAIPVRENYRFAGWYTDADCKNEFDDTMPGKDLTLYAKWERIEVNYTVRHYKQDLPVLDEFGCPEEGQEKTYTLTEEEVYKAPTGQEVSPAVKNYEGFTSPAGQKAVVTADENGTGSLVVSYYYDRNEYLLKWHLYEGGEAYPMMIPYGAPVTIPDERESYKHGYRVEKWYEDENLTIPFTADTMPAQDLNAYPKWVPEEIEYRVYYEFLDETHVIGSFEESYRAVADTTIKPPEVKQFTGYTFDESTRINSFKVDPYNPCVNYKYQINTHSLTYKYETNDGPQTETDSKKYAEDITRTNPERNGYAFAGWYTDSAYEHPFTGTTMPDEDLTLYGKWVDGLQSYQVWHYIKDLKGGEKLYAVDVLYGEPGTEVTPETKAPEGFADTAKITHTLIQGSVDNNIIKYVYERKKYQITYILNGGEADFGTTQSLAYEESLPQNPYRAGYEFAGWYLDEGLTEPLKSDTVPAHDLTLYAKWNVGKSQYVVEHYLEYGSQDGYMLERREYLYADTDSTVEPVVKTYEGYISPSVKQGTVIGTDGDPKNRLVIEYKYDCNRHQLTLHGVCKNYLDVEDTTETVKYGMYIEPQRRMGYTFGGWYEDQAYTKLFTELMPDKDFELFAKWIPDSRPYTIVHYIQDLYGIYQVEEIEKGTAETGSFVTVQPKSYPGFTAPEAEKVQIQANTGNLIELKYARNRHTVTFRLENGNADVVRRGYYGCEIHAPNPERTGYTFVGWDSKVVDTMPDADLIYTAKWSKNSYKLTYVIDEETISETYEYGAEITPRKEPEKLGYTFDKWSGTVPDTMPDHDVNLTAQWTPEIYPISYDLDGGTEYYNPKFYQYESNEIILNAPTRGGYEFIGWSGDGIEGIQKTVTIPKHSTGKRSYKANWKVITYTIEFVPNKMPMDAMEPIVFTGGAEIKLPKYGTSPEGYSFAGWTRRPEEPSDNPWYNYRDQETVKNLWENVKLYPVYRPNKYKVTFDYNKGSLYYTYNWYNYGTTIGIPQVDASHPGNKWGYKIDGWDRTDGGGYLDATETSFALEEAKDIEFKARWTPNDTYVYAPSDKDNTYNITDDKNREISFTFYVDGKQKDKETTGDYGLGNGADYIMNMDNMSGNVVRSNFSKMKISGRYRAKMVVDGYAIMRISYMTTGGKEVKWQTKTNDLLEYWETKWFSYELDRTDLKWIKLEFDADGGKRDEYILSNLNFKVTFE